MEIPSSVIDIFSRVYGNQQDLLATVLTHSEAVAGLALDIARRKNLNVDLDFVKEAALLHDVGVIRCHAPSILCMGELPYICHGIEGRKILEQEGMPRHALVCERHTGSGLTVEDIIAQNLPLPHRDMCPQSPEEKLICYADKFFSKSGELTRQKPLEKVIAQMEKLGQGPLRRFLELNNMFQ